jgi:hypothetical protein
MIKRTPQVFELLLLDLLIHPNDALGINAMKILTEEFPKKYPRAELTSIFGVISMELKDQFFHDLVQQLNNFNDSWADRQAIFIKLGALHFPAVGKILQHFAHDPDPDCRLTLATILSHT